MLSVHWWTTRSWTSKTWPALGERQRSFVPPLVLHVGDGLHDRIAAGGSDVQDVYKRQGEIVCIAGSDGNGQTELVYGITGLEKPEHGKITLCGKEIAHASIKARCV